MKYLRKFSLLRRVLVIPVIAAGAAVDDEKVRVVTIINALPSPCRTQRRGCWPRAPAFF